MNLRDALGPGLVAVACATATVVFATRPKVEAASKPAVKVTSALLGDLAVGGKIAGWTVAEIIVDGVDAARVRFERDAVSFVLTIVPKTGAKENPPFASETHAIYYGHAQPVDGAIPAGALRAISAELIRRIDRVR